MPVIVPILLVAAGLAVVFLGLARLAARARRHGVSGVGSSSMTIVDEIFHPIAHEAHEELRARERTGSIELPGEHFPKQADGPGLRR